MIHRSSLSTTPRPLTDPSRPRFRLPRSRVTFPRAFPSRESRIPTCAVSAVSRILMLQGRSGTKGGSSRRVEPGLDFRSNETPRFSCLSSLTPLLFLFSRRYRRFPSRSRREELPPEAVATVDSTSPLPARFLSPVSPELIAPHVSERTTLCTGIKNSF